MPHKHKRKREDEESNFNLPPTSRARTLPHSAHEKSSSIFTSDADKKAKQQEKKRRKKKANGIEDDTPKAFARLMAFQSGQRVRSGLDNGIRESKKDKKAKKQSTTATTTTIPNGTKPSDNQTPSQSQPQSSSTPTTTDTTSNNNLKILPGEHLADFSARVDQSLPLSSIPRHNHKNPSDLKLKTSLTKHNKRLARMQSEWRNTETRLQEKREEEKDEAADQREEDSLLWMGVSARPGGGGGKRSKKKKREEEEDPWKILERKRREDGAGRQKNLQDVVLAPPVLKPLKNIFKDKGERVAGSGTNSMTRSITA